MASSKRTTVRGGGGAAFGERCLYALLTLAAALLTVVPVAHAHEYTWVGAASADADWNIAANWESSDGGTSYPNAADDTAVFTGDARPRTLGSYTVGGLKLTAAGTLTINTYGNRFRVAGPNARFDFADGSTAVFTGGGAVEAADDLATKLTITGVCTVSNEVALGTSRARFAEVNLEKGTFASAQAVCVRKFHVGPGAAFVASSGGLDYSETCFDLAAGAVADLTSNNYGNGVGAFSGAGTVRGFRGRLSLPDGPYVFSGTCENMPNGSMCDWTINPIGAQSADAHALVVGSANALSNCAVRLPDSAGRSLRFAAGIGTFRLGELAASSAQSLCLADEADAPVTVFCRVAESALSSTLTSGPGDLYVGNRSNSAITYTGSTLFRHTGVLGGFAGVMGQDAQNTFFGDKADAANDAKLDGLAGIAGWNFGPSAMSVRNYFRNVNAFTLNGLYGNGLFQFEGAGTATIQDLAVAPLDGKRPHLVLDANGGDVVVATARAGACNLQLGAGRTLTVNGGTIGSAEARATVNAPGLGTGGDGTLILAGATLHASMDSYARRIEVRDGGVLAHYGRLNVPASATAADPATLHVDGGTLRAVWPAGGYWPIELPHASNAARQRITVGTGGAHFDVVRDNTEYSLVVAAPVSGSGRVEKTGCANLEFRHPFDIAGDFHLREGGLVCAVLEDSAALLGSGDFILGNGWLDLGSYGHACGLATGTGSSFRYRNCGSVVVNGGQAAQVTIGSAGNAAFVREAKGSVLSFCSRSPADSLDGNGATITVAGSVGVTRAGVLDQPVFALTRAATDRYAFDFLRLDEANRLVNASGLYKTAFVASGDDIVNVTSATTLAGDATCGGLRVQSATLTIPADATLSFSNEDCPAAILLGNGSAAGSISGDGTLDFGAREGVIAVGLSGSDSYHLSGRIAAKICGTGGLTLSGNLLFGHSSIRLAASNAYSGGTWINAVEAGAEADGCFGTGDVYVGTGVGESGSLRLGNVTLANALHVTGDGKLLGATASAQGVVSKNDAGVATLTGAVELTGDVAVVRTTEADAKIVFAGEISGHALTVAGGATAAGEVRLTGANSYTGGTQVVGATLALGNARALGTGAVTLAGGTLALENGSDFTLANEVSGTGTVALRGKGRVTFAAVDSAASLTLHLGDARRVAVSSLKGFAAVTTARSASVTLWVTDDAEGSFAGSVPANVTVAYGEPKKPGLCILIK